jgi:hypothetical protein
MRTQDEMPLRRPRSRGTANLETDAQLTHRQRSRLADLNLLLDKVLDTKTLTLQKELKRCGLLSQLQFVTGNNFGLGYSHALRKVCRVVEALSFSTEEVLARRSAQGNFLSVLQLLTKNADKEVRKRSLALLDKHAPAGAVPRGQPRGGWHAERGSDGARRSGPGSSLPTPPHANGPSLWPLSSSGEAPTAPPVPRGVPAPVPPIHVEGEAPFWLPEAAAVGAALAQKRAAALDLRASSPAVLGAECTIMEGLLLDLYGAGALTARHSHRRPPQLR